jgi:hypothetical protein
MESKMAYSKRMKLQTYLDDIERCLDEQEEAAVFNAWKCFADGDAMEGPFEPLPRKQREPGIDWPKININDAISDEDLMIIHQFAEVSAALSDGGVRMHTIRSNYGVGIIPSIFGVEIFIMPYEMDTKPNVRCLAGDAIERLVDSDLPDFTNGFGAQVLSVGEKYMEIKQKYPKIDKYLRIDHPDCQGPFDLCELLYGSGIFVDLYDKPELIHALLRKLSDFYKAFLDKWFSIVPRVDDYHSYFGILHRGNICVRDDSAMNLSPNLYEEFVYPYDYEVLKHFNGGAVHFCGRGDHYIKKMSEMDCLYHVDMSQPDYNNMAVIFENTLDKGITLAAARGKYLDSLPGGAQRLSRFFGV